MSRNPDPVEIRELKNDKAHAHRYAGIEHPKPSISKAVPPAGLSESATIYFNEIVEQIEEMYPCSKSDSYALTLYANNHEQLLYLEQYLRLNGLTYEVDTMASTIIKPRPEVAIHKECKFFEMKILNEFGLTPGGRAKIKIKPKEKKKTNAFADLDAVND